MIPKAKKLLNNRKGKALTAVCVAVVLLLTSFFGYTAYASGEKSINLVENGKKISITTRTDTVAELLKERGINVDKHHDLVQPSLKTALKDGLTVKWDKAYQVDIQQNGHKSHVWTTAKTVGQALNKKGITLGAHDVVNPAKDTKLKNKMLIRVQRGIQVTLADGTKSQKVWTIPMTVSEFLKQQHVTLDDNDKLSPANANEQLKAGETVSVIRVDKKQEEKQVAIDYKTIQKNDASLPKGDSNVIQPGKEGQELQTFEVTYENGKEVKRDLVKTEVQTQPQNKIVAVGTKVVHQMSYRTSRSFSGDEKTLYMRSTAYTASCSGCRGITTTGINLKLHPDAKVIAVDPSIIPLGTKVYVEGYGYAIAGDTGGSISGNRIDVFLPTQSQASSWGMRTVKVKILD